MSNKSNKPQAAIEAGLLNRQEATEFLGVGVAKFNSLSKKLGGIKVGGDTYYSPKVLTAYLTNLKIKAENANIQQPELIPA